MEEDEKRRIILAAYQKATRLYLNTEDTEEGSEHYAAYAAWKALDDLCEDLDLHAEITAIYRKELRL